MRLKSTANRFVFLLTLFVLALLGVGRMTPAFGQGGSIVGSSHDLSSGGDACGYCHTPHISPRGATLLWAPLFSQTNFGIYDSPTMDFMELIGIVKACFPNISFMTPVSIRSSPLVELEQAQI